MCRFKCCSRSSCWPSLVHHRSTSRPCSSDTNALGRTRSRKQIEFNALLMYWENFVGATNCTIGATLAAANKEPGKRHARSCLACTGALAAASFSSRCCSLQLNLVWPMLENTHYFEVDDKQLGLVIILLLSQLYYYYFS